METTSLATYLEEMANPAWLEAIKIQTDYIAEARETRGARQEAGSWGSEDDSSWHGEDDNPSSVKDENEERGHKDDHIMAPEMRGQGVVGDNKETSEVLHGVDEPHVPSQCEVKQAQPHISNPEVCQRVQEQRPRRTETENAKETVGTQEASGNKGEATKEDGDKQQGQRGQIGDKSSSQEPGAAKAKENQLASKARNEAPTVNPAWVPEDRNQERQRQRAQDKGERRQESASGTSGRDANAHGTSGARPEQERATVEPPTQEAVVNINTDTDSSEETEVPGRQAARSSTTVTIRSEKGARAAEQRELEKMATRATARATTVTSGAVKDGRDGKRKAIEITTKSSGDPEQAKPKQRARTPVDETKARRTVQPTKRAASTGGARGQSGSETLGTRLSQTPQRVDGRRQPDSETSSSPTDPILTKPVATKPGTVAKSKQAPTATGRSAASRGTRPPTEAPARSRNPNHNDSPPQGHGSDRDQGVQQEYGDELDEEQAQNATIPRPGPPPEHWGRIRRCGSLEVHLAASAVAELLNDATKHGVQPVLTPATGDCMFWVVFLSCEVRDLFRTNEQNMMVVRPDSAEHLKEITLRWMAGVVGTDQGLANYMPGKSKAERQRTMKEQCDAFDYGSEVADFVLPSMLRILGIHATIIHNGVLGRADRVVTHPENETARLPMIHLLFIKPSKNKEHYIATRPLQHGARAKPFEPWVCRGRLKCWWNFRERHRYLEELSIQEAMEGKLETRSKRGMPEQDNYDSGEDEDDSGTMPAKRKQTAPPPADQPRHKRMRK